ncbi:hypothetical protein C4J81_16455 [Deltaproteobacteria bacterium Smac51]|nr:hypothetical protein C4J81_16455 [Deltaproteobacteria bacterium Smac51]
MDKIKSIATIALLAGLLVGMAHFRMLSAENDRLTGRLSDLERANQVMAAEISANHAALKAREAERQRLAEETAALKQKLQEVYDNDQQARTWANTDCPDGVLECLRR